MRLLAFVARLLLLLFARSEFRKVSTQILAGQQSSAPMLQYAPPRTTYVDANEVVNQMYRDGNKQRAL